MKTVISFSLGFYVLFSVALFAQNIKQPLSFTSHTQTVGPMTAKWLPQPIISDMVPHDALIAFENKSDQAVTLRLRFYSVDTISPLNELGQSVPAVEKEITVPGRGKVDERFRFRLMPDTYSAHYPLHVKAEFEWEGKRRYLHTVRVIETDMTKVKSDTASTTVIQQGGVSLLRKFYKVTCKIQGEQPIELGNNWTGTSVESKAFLNLSQKDCGESRPCFSIHPPYKPRGGSLCLDFPVRLPKSDGMFLRYGVAIGSVLPPEVPGDGVTFRILGTRSNGEKKLLDEIHTTSTVWVDRIVNLATLADSEFILTLEINPGPKNNYICDGCFVSDLVIGPSKETEATNLNERGKVFRFPLTGGTQANVTIGDKGLFDATFALKNNTTGAEVIYNGLDLSIAGRPIESMFPLLMGRPVLVWDEQNKKLTEIITLLREDQCETITISIYADRGMLIIDLPEGNPDRIGPFGLKSANVDVHRFWFGHGYVVEEPTRLLNIYAGGHNLSTSHVGFDYISGLSVLMGCSVPPERMTIAPQKKTATLMFRGIGKLALLPDTQNAMHAAIAYRSLCPWYPSPSKGVTRKIGRFVFDIWGGHYKDNMNWLEKIFDWGVTDSFFIRHMWQRWGYDVRLPDIWGDEHDEYPVSTEFGSFDELRQLAKMCRKHNVPFGLHDNYTDFYPDAENFSYRYINFHENGQPKKGWINHGAAAQGYQWRPDMFKPFLIRNLERTKQMLPEVDAYFVDVLCSMNTFDFFTQNGEFRSHTQTQKCWKEAFEIIGQKLSFTDDSGKKQTAITVSEAGDDFLIGSVDSADAQWPRLSQKRETRTMWVPCGNWARTPWFAAVNHTNFSRHGAGYSDRYAGLRYSKLHDPLSDDYISAEILGGLDLMSTDRTLYPGSIRKHYLAQHVVRHLADKEIVDFRFGTKNGKTDIKRQTIIWSDGTCSYVNRSDSDWELKQGIILPLYGYAVFDVKGKLMSAIMRNPAAKKEVVEISQRIDSFYINGRGNETQRVYAITPEMESFRIMDNGRFSVKVKWQSEEPVPADANVFVHIFEAYRGDGHTPRGWFAGGEKPSVPTAQWGSSGHEIVSTGENQILHVPEDLPSGTYQITVGLYEKKHRFVLMGEYAGENRFAIAELIVTRPGGKIHLDIRPLKMTESRELYSRLNANRHPLSWQGVSTCGAVSVTPGQNEWRLVPVPVLSPFEVVLDQKAIGRSVVRIIRDQKEIPIQREGDLVRLTVEADSPEPYRIIW